MSYYSTIMRDGPKGYFRLNDASGTTAKDSSGNGYDGSYNGTFGLSQPGAIVGDPNNAVSLNGTTGYIALGAGLSLNGLSNFTIEIWANVSGGTVGRVVANDDPSGAHKGIFLEMGTSASYSVMSTGGVATQINFPSFTTGLWYHYVVSYDGVTMRGYINGTQSASQAATGPLDAADFPINIGRNPAYNGDYFPGLVDEAAIYYKTLSADQIKNHYRVGTTSSTARVPHRAFARVQ